MLYRDVTSQREECCFSGDTIFLEKILLLRELIIPINIVCFKLIVHDGA